MGGQRVKWIVLVSLVALLGWGTTLELLLRNQVPLLSKAGLSLLINMGLVWGLPAAIVAVGLAVLAQRLSRWRHARSAGSTAIFGAALLLIGARWRGDDLASVAADQLWLTRLCFGVFLLLAGLILLLRLKKGTWLALLASTAIALVVGGIAYARHQGMWLTPRSGVPTPAAHAAPWKGRVLVVAVDGLSWDVLQRWLQTTDAAPFDWLRTAASINPLATFVPTRSPVVWSTIATGTRLEQHGVVDFTSLEFTLPWVVRLQELPPWAQRIRWAVQKLPHARENTVATYELHRKPFWEIIKNRPVYVVGWWVSWPAQPVWGALIADHFYFWRKEFEQGSHWLQKAGVTWPPELLIQLERFRVQAERVDRTRLEKILGIQLPPDEQIDEPIPGPKPLRELRTAFAMDETYFSIMEYFLRRGPRNGLYTVYVRGIDLVSHAALRYSDLYPEISANSAESQWYGQLVQRYYRYTFQRISRLIQLAGPNTIVLIVSDHGFEYDPQLPELFGHYHAPTGVVIAYGPKVRRGLSQITASVFDICPTLLWLAGYPKSQEMPGRPLSQLFDGLPSPRREAIPSYGYRLVTGLPAYTHPRQLRESLELLRGLGYIR